MIDSQISVQQAIYDYLYNARYGSPVLLSTSVSGIFDIVPDSQAFPYITIGNMTTIDDSTQGIAGQEITLTVHVWDQAESRLRIKQITAQIIELLHHAALTPTGSPQLHNLINIMYEFSDLFLDPDNRTHHSIVRFRIVTDAKA